MPANPRKSPLYPPFIKGGKFVGITPSHPPFLKASGSESLRLGEEIERLSDNPPKALYVILSEAKNLIDPSTYTFEILRPPAADSE